jgi:hypothetical protein
VFFGWLCWTTYLATPSGADPFLFRGGLFLAGLATLAIIAAVTHRGAHANRLLGNPVFRWLGTRSYGLYLYHWPIYQMIRGVAGNKLTVSEFLFAMLLTAGVTEVSYRLIEIPIRRGQFGTAWRRIFAGTRRGPKLIATGVVATVAVVGLATTAVLVTAPVEQNEIAQALDEGEEFTTNLLSVDDIPLASTTSSSTTITTEPTATTAETVPPTTTAAPETTVPPAPLTQLGVVSSLDGLQPLAVPPNVSGFPLVALGDSVMLGAAEELQARGFQVDAQQSRQMKVFVPAMQALRDSGTFGSVVVVHLGTNGGFSQETLDAMLATVADVPVVLLLTGKADRGWIAGNNEALRAVPATHPNVTVVDWEVLAASCEGRCFYDDGIHLTQSGQYFYADVIARVLGLP